MCDCIYCQLDERPLKEQYIFYKVQLETANYVLGCLEEAGIEFSFAELNNNVNPLNTLGCVMWDQQVGAATALGDLEKNHPELVNYFKF